MKNLSVIALLVCVLIGPGQVLAQGEEEDQKIYLDEVEDERRDWALGIGLGLVELGDNFVQGGIVISDDTVEQYTMLSLRIPFGDRRAHGGGGGAGFSGYLEPELGYWDSDFSSDLLLRHQRGRRYAVQCSRVLCRWGHRHALSGQ